MQREHLRRFVIAATPTPTLSGWEFPISKGIIIIMLDWNSLYASGKDFGILPENVIDFIIENTDSKSSKELLDIGCGTGQLTRSFEDRGYICLGIDPSSEAIKIASSRSSQSRYEVGTLQTLNLTNPYGLITCKHVYAFINDKPAFLQQVANLLLANGSFVIITPLAEDTPADKHAITADGATLRQDLSKYFTSIIDRPLKSGQLFILKPKAN